KKKIKTKKRDSTTEEITPEGVEQIAVEETVEVTEKKPQEFPSDKDVVKPTESDEQIETTAELLPESLVKDIEIIPMESSSTLSKGKIEEDSVTITRTDKTTAPEEVQPEEEQTSEITLKKKIKKPKSITESTVEVKPELEKSVETTTEEFVEISTVPSETVSESVTLTKPDKTTAPEEVQPEVEQTSEITLKKKIKKPKSITESTVEVKPESVESVTEETVKISTVPSETVSESVTLTKPDKTIAPEEVQPEVEQTSELTLKKKIKKPKSITESTVEVKPESVESVTEETVKISTVPSETVSESLKSSQNWKNLWKQQLKNSLKYLPFPQKQCPNRLHSLNPTKQQYRKKSSQTFTESTVEVKPESVESVTEETVKISTVPSETVSESVTLTKPDKTTVPEEVQPEVEQTSEITLKKKIKKPKSITESTVEVKPESRESVEKTDTTQTFKLRKPSKESIDQTISLNVEQTKKELEDISTEIMIKKKPKQKSVTTEGVISLSKEEDQQRDTESNITVDLSLESNLQTDETSDEIISQTFKLKKTSADSDDQSVSLSIKQNQKQLDDICAEISIKKKSKPRDYSDSQTIHIKDSQDIVESDVNKTIEIRAPIEEDIENITLDLRQKKSIDRQTEEEELEQSFRLPKRKSEESVTFTVDEKKTTISDISTDITIKKKLKPKVCVEEDSASIRIEEQRDITGEEESTFASITLPEEEAVVDTIDSEIETIEKQVIVEKDQVFNIGLKKVNKTEESAESYETEFKAKRISTKKVLDFSETEKSFDLSLAKQKSSDERIKQLDESATIQLDTTPDKSYQISEEAAELTLKKEVEVQEVSALTIKKEIQVEELIATITVVSEVPNMISVSEGDRLYVVERHTSDWWFVRKRLTNESGYIESKNLVDSTAYTHILRNKVEEKIHNIPVYEVEEPDDTFEPRFVRDLQCMYAWVGETVTFECQVEGNPRPTITWFKHSSILKANDEIQMYYEEDNSAKLIIKEVFAEDSGKYTVVAKNSIGYKSYTVDLNVEGEYSDVESVTTSRKSMSRESSIISILEGIPPVFAEPPKSIEIKKGKSFHIEVCVNAQTKPSVRWLRNGIEIKESKRIQMKSTEDIYYYKYRLEVEKASEDDGLYEIIAENKDGFASTTVVVYNEEKKQKPEFTQTFDDLFVEEESDITLSVKYTGHPKP
ncbi:unnamed protein product, partial [Oppiella nova]